MYSSRLCGTHRHMQARRMNKHACAQDPETVETAVATRRRFGLAASSKPQPGLRLVTSFFKSDNSAFYAARQHGLAAVKGVVMLRYQ